MDFTLDQDQQAISALAGRILTEQLTPARLGTIETQTGRFAADTWAELARAQLLGAPLSEDAGGGGFGIVEACLVLEQVGRTVAPLPYFASIILGAMAIDAFGSPEQRARYLPAVCRGSLILTAALAEAGEVFVPALPATVAIRDGGGWRLEGEKRFVPAAHLAGIMLVPARTGSESVGVFLVDPAAPGVTLARVETTSLEPQFIVTLCGTKLTTGDVLGEPERGAAIVDWIVQRAIAGLCSMQAGVCEAALRLTARHLSEREQFNVKLATFQAVAHRAADAYIDTEAVTLTARHAAWRLAAKLPAEAALAVAKYWAAEGGQRVAHAAQHLHGGIGVDTAYPLHRYFRWSKQIELTLGGAMAHLARLGTLIATQTPGENA
ncbi:MAG: acyl-CoA/acyl-ACP dehydrogenase [Deltaproteobacteria bacterium]|nr:acyl-CoA/acyl-ACP dehydrogenase [Deltaproteobacteria bacterium]